eukprot:TRINITY_DN7153_c0_g1_i2.p1 TRINITY_DN7153_c0_g1~~TRINITY_DN7153_c0_g1_i2.p1  ORF type:complete len:1103 (-),score=306.90 TRINITY_DN7153_c0_g1_i2:47-3286(-)
MLILFSFSQAQVNSGEYPQIIVSGQYSALVKNTGINGIGRWHESTGVWEQFDRSPQSTGRINYMTPNGTTLYIGGSFTTVGGNSSMYNIVAFDTIKQTFQPLCGGTAGEVNWISIQGPRVYVAGSFSSVTNCDGTMVWAQNIAIFSTESNTWGYLQKGIIPGVINTIHVIEQDSNPWVCAAGIGMEGSFIQIYSNSTWSTIDMSYGDTEFYNDYSVVTVDHVTRDIYVGGHFETIRGKTVNHVAVYNQSKKEWASLAQGIISSDGFAQVHTLVLYRRPNGDLNLIVGGHFSSVGEIAYISASNIALWDGSTWNSLGNGISGNDHVTCRDVQAAVHDISLADETIYVSGRFTRAGSYPAANIAAFNLSSSEWIHIRNESAFVDSVIYSNAVVRDSVYVIGIVQKEFANSEFSTGLAILGSFNRTSFQWNILTVNPLFGFLNFGEIHCVVENGTDLYVGGQFITAGGMVMHNVAKWNGKEWISLDIGINDGVIYSMDIHGSDLYVGGRFNLTSHGKDLFGVARWNDQDKKWSSLGDGLIPNCDYNDSVNAIMAFDDLLFVAGSFRGVSPLKEESANIACWNMTSQEWVAMDGGVPNGIIYSLLINDTFLYVGGRFQLENPMKNGWNVAIWSMDSPGWLPHAGVKLTSSMSTYAIYDMVMMGPYLVVGGVFDTANGDTVNNLAVQIQLEDWTNVGLGVTKDPSAGLASVNALAYDDATKSLFVGGVFDNAGRHDGVNNLAQFNTESKTWTELGTIAQWQGPVYGLTLVVGAQDLVSADHGLSVRELVMISLGVGVLVAIVVGSSAIFILKIRRRRDYAEIPIYHKKRISIKDLADNTAVKQIEPKDIQIGIRLATGASGEVSKGVWNGKIVAVKRVYSSSIAVDDIQMSSEFMQDFLNEIQLMSGLQHDNVLKFFGASITKGDEIFLVIEYMEHGSLRDLLLRTEGQMDRKLKLRLAIDAASGMEYLHSRNPVIIHRDLKSSNLLIDKKWRCKVADFGVSRIKPFLTQTMTTVGTPAYMAPEVILKNEYSEKVDVYSFGIVLNEIDTGQPPYGDSTLFPQQVMYAVAHEGIFKLKIQVEKRS